MHALSALVCVLQCCGYVAISTFVEYRWYHRRMGSVGAWKTQPGKMHFAGEDARGRSKGYRWGLPALDLIYPNYRRSLASSNQKRHESHAWFATCNLVTSSLFAGATCEAYLSSWRSTLVNDDAENMDVFKIVIGLALAVTWQSVLEYYWHRAMHLPAVYAKLHKFHHHYKAPQPWDDLFIHPLESFGYCLILYSPAFCIPNLPVASFLSYMSIMGVCGILDHCGVRIQVRLFYVLYQIAIRGMTSCFVHRRRSGSTTRSFTTCTTRRST